MQTFTFPGGRNALYPLGQGTWTMGDDASQRKNEIRALQVGIERGLAIIDTAEMYGNGRSETLVGEAIAGRRDSVFLVSKVLPSRAGLKGITPACEGSLKRLNVDCLDLYLLHWAGSYSFAETIEGMRILQDQGKIRAWGVSNLDIDEMETFFALAGGTACATNQVLYNLARRGIEYDLLPWCCSKKLPVMAYSPVEQGRILNHPALLDAARRYNVTPAAVALAWLLRKPGVVTIPKAGSEAHVRENAQALSLELDNETLQALDAAFPPPKCKRPLEIL